MTSNIAVVFVTPFPTTSTLLNCVIDGGVEAILLETYGSGSVPEKIVPQIQKATSNLIPVFAIRQTWSNCWRTEWSMYEDQIVPGVYHAEVIAIAAGMIPLQKDLFCEIEVIEGIQEICSTYHDYDSRIREVRRRFSSKSFNSVLDKVKEKYC